MLCQLIQSLPAKVSKKLVTTIIVFEEGPVEAKAYFPFPTSQILTTYKPSNFRKIIIKHSTGKATRHQHSVQILDTLL